MPAQVRCLTSIETVSRFERSHPLPFGFYIGIGRRKQAFMLIQLPVGFSRLNELCASSLYFLPEHKPEVIKAKVILHKRNKKPLLLGKC